MAELQQRGLCRLGEESSTGCGSGSMDTGALCRNSALGVGARAQARGQGGQTPLAGPQTPVWHSQKCPQNMQGSSRSGVSLHTSVCVTPYMPFLSFRSLLHLGAVRIEVDSRAPGIAGTTLPPSPPISECQGPVRGHQHLPGHRYKGQGLPV